MGRPQFVKRADRPQDEAGRTGQNEFETSTDSLDTDTVYIKNYQFDEDYDRILEAVSVAPLQKIKTPVRCKIVVDDADGNPNGQKIARYPDGIPIHFDGGVNVPAGGSVAVKLYQISGEAINIDIVLQLRRAE